MAKSLSWPLWPQALSASCLLRCRWCRRIRLSGRHVARTICGQGAEVAGQARNRRCGGFSYWLFHCVRCAGASVSVIGSLIRAYSGPLAIIAGIAIIIMGLHFLGVTPIGFLQRQKRIDVSKPVGLWGAYVIGLAFAFGWTPCIGPILAAILAVAASEQTVTKGASLLAVYSLGLGIPFMIAAFAIEPFAAFLSRFRNHLHRVEQAMGALLVLTGIAFLTGSINQMSVWLLETFPILGKIG